MAALRQLAGQTVIYGLSSIVGRLLNYLLVPLYTYTFSEVAYGVVTELYAYTAFLLVVFTYGMETAFFRFYEQRQQDPKVFSTGQSALVVTTLVFSGLLFLLAPTLSDALYIGQVKFIRIFALILAFDALSALPFARLRAQHKALAFAGIKLINIGLNIGLNLLFLIVLPALSGQHSVLGGLAEDLYRPEWGIYYIFLANLIASGVTVVLLLPQFRQIRWGFDWNLWQKMLRYAWPLIIVGLAGIVNETIDRILLKFLLPGTPIENQAAIGIYGACYKLSILMTLFIQAYRYAAEPFFFAQAQKENAKDTYALSLTAFFLVGVLIFLGVMLYMDIFQYFIGPAFRVGLAIVPILLLANLFLGVYYNLSIWYKLTDKTGLGAWVAGGGALLTLILNILLIPELGYIGAAWTTLAVYSCMTVVSWWLGQRYYPVSYPIGRLALYLTLAIGLFFLAQGLYEWGLTASLTVRLFIHTLLLMTFVGITAYIERPWQRWRTT